MCQTDTLIGKLSFSIAHVPLLSVVGGRARSVEKTPAPPNAADSLKTDTRGCVAVDVLFFFNPVVGYLYGTCLGCICYRFLITQRVDI